MSISGPIKIAVCPPKGPGRPRDAQKDAAIIVAAQRLFLERGFDGASVDAIAEAAGVAKATVYARFADKEALLREAIAAKCGSFLDAVPPEGTAGPTLRDGLIGFSRRFLLLVTDTEALSMHRLMMQEGQRSDRLPTLFFDCAIRPTMRRLAAYLESESALRRRPLKDAEGAAWRFLGMVKGEDHMRAMFGMPPRAPAEIERHLAACADDFIAANFP